MKWGQMQSCVRALKRQRTLDIAVKEVDSWSPEKRAAINRSIGLGNVDNTTHIVKPAHVTRLTNKVKK